MSTPVWAWIQFLACAALIGAAGSQLSRYGDAIAQHTGLSGSWIGLTLVASVTSLPELATGITSVTIAQAPNLAVGNALGSCVLNLAFLVLIDLIYRHEPVWSRASRGHVLAAAFGVVLLGFLLIGLLIGHLTPASSASASPQASAWGVGLMTPFMLVLYMIAMRTVFVYERAHPPPEVASSDSSAAQKPGLRQAIMRFALAASVVVGAGLWLPFAAVDLATAMGWNRSFMGSLFVAMATTLPELAVTLSALRLGALDMAIGNLLGSNLFNVTIVAVDDLFYRPGVLLADVSLVHAVTASSAIVMTGLAVVGLFFRPRDRVLRAVGSVSVGLAMVYLLNTYVVFLHGA